MEGIFKASFASHYSALILIGNKLNSFPQVVSVLPVMAKSVSDLFLS